MLESVGPVVVIASAREVGAVRIQLRAQPNARVFSETDFLLALNTIMADVPKVIVLDPEFAATARGAALVARVKSDPRLSGSQIRALVRPGANRPAHAEPTAMNAEHIVAALQPLDHCGTRHAARFAMKDDTEARINGTPARLVNLSVTGAQVLAQIRLRPAERVRLILVDDSAELRLAGIVAWATLEISPKEAAQRYRYGVEFRNSDANKLEKYCLRYGKDTSRSHQ